MAVGTATFWGCRVNLAPRGFFGIVMAGFSSFWRRRCPRVVWEFDAEIGGCTVSPSGLETPDLTQTFNRPFHIPRHWVTLPQIVRV